MDPFMKMARLMANAQDDNNCHTTSLPEIKERLDIAGTALNQPCNFSVGDYVVMKPEFIGSFYKNPIPECPGKVIKMTPGERLPGVQDQESGCNLTGIIPDICVLIWHPGQGYGLHVLDHRLLTKYDM